MGRQQNFTADDDATIMADVGAKVPTYETALTLGRSIEAIYARRSYLRSIGCEMPMLVCKPQPKNQRKTYEQKPKARGATAIRQCLGCPNRFRSDGPHHRLCHNCRARARDVSPYAPS